MFMHQMMLTLSIQAAKLEIAERERRLAHRARCQTIGTFVGGRNDEAVTSTADDIALPSPAGHQPDDHAAAGRVMREEVEVSIAVVSPAPPASGSPATASWGTGHER